MTSRSRRSQLHIVRISSGQYMAVSMMGHVDLTALMSRMVVSSTLLNRGTHCIYSSRARAFCTNCGRIANCMQVVCEKTRVKK